MNFSQQTESAQDRTKLFMENNPTLKLKAELLLSWLKDVGEVDEDETLDELTFRGHYYDMDLFSVGMMEYAVGTEYETDQSCKEYIEELIETEGIESFNTDFVKQYLDKKDLQNYAADFFGDDIYNYPEGYFDEEDRMLSNKQREQVEILQMRLDRLKQSIQQFEERSEGPNSEWFQKKIAEFEEVINEYEEEILDIQSDPKGDFPDDLIEKRIEETVLWASNNPWQFIDEYSVDWEQFIDKDEMIEEAINLDGYGHFLAKYDGDAHEVYSDGELFYIMRID